MVKNAKEEHVLSVFVALCGPNLVHQLVFVAVFVP
jgi:hypothetical protein